MFVDFGLANQERDNLFGEIIVDFFYLKLLNILYFDYHFGEEAKKRLRVFFEDQFKRLEPFAQKPNKVWLPALEIFYDSIIKKLREIQRTLVSSTTRKVIHDETHS